MSRVQVLAEGRLTRRVGLDDGQLEWLRTRAQEQVDDYIVRETAPMAGVLTSLYASLLAAASVGMTTRMVVDLLEDNLEDLWDLAQRQAERTHRERTASFTGEVYPDKAVVEVHR